MYKNFTESKGFLPSVSLKFFETLYNFIDGDSENNLTHFSRKAINEGDILGYISVLSIGKNALEFLRVDNTAKKTQFSSKHLTHTVILDAVEREVYNYDFGGVDKKNQPGIYGFKRGFGGMFVHTSGYRILK
jgi:lipid II:glycine glycyltransferase (peptidoglycan interpeptide bridge formation enzyme)